MATVLGKGDYVSLYDQAGLMIRIDEKHWIKMGIEFVNGVQQVSAVVTRDYSDWSVVPLAHPPAFLWLRLLRKGDSVEITYSSDEEQYTLLRLAFFPPEVMVQIGLMAAAPDGAGFEAIFEDLAVVPC
jgi:regulation of enolase protein 1 (concanavalin A-like superfamily)